MRIYISSAMTGLPEQNYPAFFDMEKNMVEKGYDVANPARIGVDMEATFAQSGISPTRRDYLVADLAELQECDAVVLFGAWRESEGAKLEAYTAQNMDIPVYYYDDQADAFYETHVDALFGVHVSTAVQEITAA